MQPNVPLSLETLENYMDWLEYFILHYKVPKHSLLLYSVASASIKYQKSKPEAL